VGCCSCCSLLLILFLVSMLILQADSLY
jgi:hypothetical protein